jgi:uncharacterized protein (DUF427 family)
MSLRMLDTLAARVTELRHEPTRTRIRAGSATAWSSTARAPCSSGSRRASCRRFAVPREHVAAELVPAAESVTWFSGRERMRVGGHAVLDPAFPFAVHTAAGEALTLRAHGHRLDGAAFRPADPDLDGLVVLDSAAFDAWYEEDAPVFGHPRDPFHRLDVLPSSRRVRLERDGVLLAESARPTLLFDGSVLPVRYYLPRDDVRVPLRASRTRTRCPYKGEASYWSPEIAGHVVHDLAWSYEDPLREAAPVAGLICFFDERVDVTVDGEPQERPVTPWSDG